MDKHKINKSLADQEKTKSFKDLLLKAYPFIALVLIILIFEIWSKGKLLTARNYKTIINEAFRMILGAAALAFVISQGAIDLSTGSVIGIAAAAGAICATKFGPAGIFVTILVGVAVGFINGIVYARLRVNAFITTLAMSYMLGGLLDTVLEGGSASIPYAMLSWNTTGLRVITLLVIVGIGYALFEYGKLGKQCKAIGSNEVAARQSGVNIERVKLTAFVITGLMAGILAFFTLIRTGTASTSTGNNFQMDSMIAVLLGGMPITGGSSAKFRAAIIGGLTMALLSNGMNIVGIDSLIQQLVRGCIFLGAVALTFNRKTMAVIK